MATLKGNASNNTINGTSSADSIYGYAGNDTLYGKAGNDLIWGGIGSDRLFGEAGNDTLRGEAGDDFAYGSDGNDLIYGGTGNDTLHGDAGTDTIYGEAGIDTLKAGTGIAKLYGGDGNDKFYYDPTTANISSLGNYLSTTTMDGGLNYDTLNVYNKATYTKNGVTRPAVTEISIEGYGDDDRIVFGGDLRTDPWILAGTFKNIERITVTGPGSLDYFGSIDGDDQMTIVGTSSADYFFSSWGKDIMDGGAGNDVFTLAEGNIDDVIYSTSTDSDKFWFDVYGGSGATITGFNGVGKAGGDEIHFNFVDRFFYPNPSEALAGRGKMGLRSALASAEA
ncbi:hypothetical protein IGS68_29930 (plasmid) [Skermanella sp. TT6]|uniref:Hemolysin type calcium-binding protein n=1 Tax=Skermanella cutis TaxID=2775420 RepID=A0ABX7BE80_9PROT|nr:calcium-binding protein [Skermanella sp. TT6]QQP92692.1 hypothetical protein IGS68_29930 [Skermanella sp. TT6]